MDHSSDRAQGRWKILQQAILRRHAPLAAPNAHSIHHFPGYEMIPSPQPFVSSGNTKAVENNPVTVALDMQHQLMKEFCSDDEDFCIYEYSIPIQEEEPNNEYPESGDPTLPRFALRGDIRVYTRETLARQRRRMPSLAELVQHRERDQIDNTGNICVWDSARTLCWAVLRSITTFDHILPFLRQPSSSTRTAATVVLELGSGMAGLAALSLAAWMYAKYKLEHFSQQFHFFITDGHVECVRNNQRNVQIMRTVGSLPDKSFGHITIDCSQLLWSLEPSFPKDVEDGDTFGTFKIADYVLVADCTHFEQYHGELYWTMVTRAKNQIIMCQPNRNPSWDRFMSLVNAVNAIGESKPLLHVSEQQFPEVIQKHDSFIQENYTNYDPNKHFPRLFVFDVLRTPTELDRQCVIQHVQRDF